MFHPDGTCFETFDWYDKVSNNTVTVGTVLEGGASPDAKPMPVTVYTNDDKENLILLWEHDGPGFPRLVDVGDEVVIAVMRNGTHLKENGIERIYPIRDLLTDIARPADERLNLKRESAKVIGVEEYWLNDEELRLEELEKEIQRDLLIDEAEARGPSTSTLSMVAEAKFLMGGQAMLRAEARETSHATTTPTKVREEVGPSDEEIRKAILARRPIRVWTKSGGKMLEGIPVTERDKLTVLPNKIQRVVTDDSGKNQTVEERVRCVMHDEHGNDWHFGIKITGRGELVKQDNQLVSRERPKVRA